MKKSITFVLCGPGIVPVGGFKVVYEYANRLAERNWIVNIIHPTSIQTDIPFIKKFKAFIQYYKLKFFHPFYLAYWFAISPKVKMLVVPSLLERYIPDADCIVACPSNTADFVNSCSIKKGRKFYFIQAYEDWVMSKEELINTWRLPMQKIVVSKHLENMLQEIGLKAVCVPNGLNTELYKAKVKYKKRPAHSLLFLAHTLELKGTRFVLEAISLLKNKFPDLQINSFGVSPKPRNFPEQITYYQNPKQTIIRELYNSSQIFISSSLHEGWDLPLCEAILSGCVAVATAIPVHLEYIINGKNGYFCEPGSAKAIAKAIEFVFEHPEEAEKVSEEGPRSLNNFNWENSLNLLENLFLCKN